MRVNINLLIKSFFFIIIITLQIYCQNIMQKIHYLLKLYI